MSVSRRKLPRQAIQRIAFQPQSVSGSTEVVGDALDLLGFDSASLGIFTGAATGAGTVSLAIKLYGVATKVTTGGTLLTTANVVFGAAYGGAGNPIAGSNTAAADVISTAWIDLANAGFRYGYVGITPTFGGSTTAILVAGAIELGDTVGSEPAV